MVWPGPGHSGQEVEAAPKGQQGVPSAEKLQQEDPPRGAPRAGRDRDRQWGQKSIGEGTKIRTERKKHGVFQRLRGLAGVDVAALGAAADEADGDRP